LDEQRRADERAEAERQIREAQRLAALAREEAAGRQVAPEQAAAIGRVLAGDPGGRVEIVSGDPESARYSEQLAHAIRAAGWSAKCSSGVGTFDYAPHTGNFLQIRGVPADKYYDGLGEIQPQHCVPRSARVLAEALEAGGIHLKFATIHDGEPGKLELFIGYKP
jgi:hypothetical protein